MILEEKQLILVDLCARIPYKIRCSYEHILPEGYLLSDTQTIGTIDNITVPLVGEITVKIDGSLRGLSDFKMYLRPMSSMTKEEKDTYDTMVMCNASWIVDDWLNSHYFDYRDLIGKGLALEAPEGMYK